MKRIAAALALLASLFYANASYASACYISQPNPPNRVTAGGFEFQIPIRFIGTGATPGDVPGGSQDTTVTVTYTNAMTDQQQRDALFTAIQAAATALGIPVPNRTACAGFYTLPKGTL